MSDASVKNIFKMIEEKNVKFVDLRFTDTRGKEQHVTVDVATVEPDFFREGKMFDGSSIAGWKNIDSSDMILMPDPNTALMDPFFEEATLILRCDIVEPSTMQAYERDPRSLARRAQEFLKSTGIADTCYCGPEPEFFIFDDVRWKVDMNGCFYSIDSQEAAWNSETHYEAGNIGHRPRVKGGYFPVPPVDSAQDIRSAMCMIMKDMGLFVETHHHEVATANQNEIDIRYDELVKSADNIQILKYVVHNVAHAYGKTATFMPKPLVGDNGSGMHCHQSLARDGKNLFAGDKYAGLSEMALYYIGGIIKHARALNAFTNPTTNSYKRLVPGFEAPVMLAYSARNRSAAIRVPYVPSPKGRRIEIRFPDPLANPYLAFAAMLMAGIDGIKNKINPGDAMDKNLYDLPPEEKADIPQVCGTLQEALECLKQDHAFLLEGDVFSQDLIDSYIHLKMEEVIRLRTTTHPIEMDMYYSG
ncbi:MAG: glutamate--ammonia ligase [Coxiellaceae bacterium]|nr:MAG: glutamate--ammonia ligase [Coxiellaceae bacterium]